MNNNINLEKQSQSNNQDIPLSQTLITNIQTENTSLDTQTKILQIITNILIFDFD